MTYPPPWMDAETLAQHISGICERTIKNWAELGIIPQPRKVGGKVMWKWEEVDAWLTNGPPGAAAEPRSDDPEVERVRNASRQAAADHRPRH